MKITFDSWAAAAQAFEDASVGAPNQVTQVVTATTDPAACGAAGGMATIDGAVAIMLTVFGEVMNSDIVPGLTTGLTGEAQALVDTGAAYQAMEDDNVQSAQAAQGGN